MKIAYDEIADRFYREWNTNTESLIWETAWDCLEKAGLTEYTDETSRSEVYVRAYAVGRLCKEFDNCAFGGSSNRYVLVWDGEPPLTADSVNALYLSNFPNGAETELNARLEALVFQFRKPVAHIILRQLGVDLWGNLLFAGMNGKPFPVDSDWEDEHEFESAQALMDYCKNLSLEDLSSMLRFTDHHVPGCRKKTLDWLNELADNCISG